MHIDGSPDALRTVMALAAEIQIAVAIAGIRAVGDLDRVTGDRGVNPLLDRIKRMRCRAVIERIAAARVTRTGIAGGVVIDVPRPRPQVLKLIRPHVDHNRAVVVTVNDAVRTIQIGPRRAAVRSSGRRHRRTVSR